MAREIPLQVVINGKDNSKGVIGSFGKALGGITKIASGVLLALGVQGLTTTMINLGKTMIQSAQDMEQQQIAFETLLGNTKKANAALNRIKEDAKSTPFELPGLIDMNKRLIAAGTSADDAADLVLSLGDAVSATGGTQVELDRLIANFQQIKSVGKASLMDIRQFGNAGIPIFDLLADSTGKSKEQIGEMISEGKIGFDELVQAFDKASGAGGRFEDAMEDQSNTLAGVISNIKDTLGILGTEIIEDSGLFDMFKDSAKRFLDLIEDSKPTIMRMVEGFKESILVVTEFFNKIKGSAKDFVKDPLLVEIKKWFDIIKDAAVLFGKTFIRVFKDNIPKIKDAFMGLKDTLTLLFENANLEGKDFITLMGDIGAILAQVLVTTIEWAIKFIDFAFKVSIAIQTLKDRVVLFFKAWGNKVEEGKIRMRQFKDSVVETSKNLWEKVKEIFNRIKDTIKNSFVRAKDFVLGIINTIKEKISGLFDSITSIPGNVTKSIGEFVGGIELPHFAEGGIVKGSPQGTLAVVGENNKDEVIAPLDKLPKTGGGMTVNVYGDVFGVDDLSNKIIESVRRKAKSNSMSASQFLDINV